MSPMPRNSKDILAKYLFGAWPEDALGVFGIHGVHVQRAIPTEEIEVIQKFTDIVWETTDGGLLHIEILSGAISSLHRFLFYDAWLSYRLEKSVRTLVLYVGKVAKAQETLDAGAIQYRVENLCRDGKKTRI